MTTDTGTTKDLDKKSKDCVAVVESICSDLTKGCLNEVEQKLQGLKGDAEELAEHAEKKAKETEKVEEQHKQKTEEIQEKIGALGCQEEEQKRRKSSLEASLSGQEAILSQMKQTLSNAESELRAAENRVSEARREEEARVGGGAAVGAIIGTLLVPGLGTLFGAAAGAGVGELLNRVIEEEKAARNRVDNCRGRCQSTERDVNSTKTSIFNAQSQISSLSSECEKLKQKRMQYNEEAKRMKEAVLFFRKVSVFWKEFQQTSEYGMDRTVLVEKLLKKANEKVDGNFLHSKASKGVGLTLLEAWKEMEEKSAEGSDFVYQIEQ